MNGNCKRTFPLWLVLVVLSITLPSQARAEHDGRVQILLLGDSTTIGSVCRQVEPKARHLEDVIRTLLATSKDLPPTNVINQGRDGEFVQGLLADDRYDREIAKLPGIDLVLIRYGLNDQARRADFAVNFPKDLAELISRLRKDFPAAKIILSSIIPYLAPEADARVNSLIRQVSESEHIAYLDIYTRYKSELEKGKNMLNYRRYALSQIPDSLREWAEPYARGGMVFVMDNRLDAHFSGLPGWFGDRHPNLAGYHVIGDETAKFLAPIIRATQKSGGAAELKKGR